MVGLKTTLCGIEFQNPFMLASGTAGYGLELADLSSLDSLGAICTKGLSPKPCEGNPTPRIVETPAGMLNAIGLQNIGAEAFLSEKLPGLKKFKAKIIVNVWGKTMEEYIAVSKRIGNAEGVAMLELNVSCPNIKEGGIQFGIDKVLLKEVTAACCEVSQVPVMVKLSPNVTDIAAMAEVAVEGGAKALSLINTLSAMVIDTKTRKPVLANGVGGLSGPAIRPVAVRMVNQVAQAVNVPVVGIGGISTLNDALEFFMAGAQAVQIGTQTFVEPGAAARLVKELATWCDQEGVKDLSEIIGCVKI